MHNQARAEAGTAALMWHAGLSHDAQQWADHLASIDRGLQHSQNRNNQGENLAAFSGTVSEPHREASKLWYQEKAAWPGGIIMANAVHCHGHYTQMIWNSTSYLGMGIATSRSGKLYIVARYYPAGNIVGCDPCRLRVPPRLEPGSDVQGESQRPWPEDTAYDVQVADRCDFTRPTGDALARSTGSERNSRRSMQGIGNVSSRRGRDRDSWSSIRDRAHEDDCVMQ